MSFFGFDTSLPRDRQGKGSGSQAARGPRNQQAFEDDPFNPVSGLGGIDDEALDAKIRGLTAGAQEDVEVSCAAAEWRTTAI